MAMDQYTYYVLRYALFIMHTCHMHVHFIASHWSLIDVHFPHMETVAGSILYFDGTWAYTAVARSFATFGGSYAPAHIHHVMIEFTVSAQLRNHHNNEYVWAYFRLPPYVRHTYVASVIQLLFRYNVHVTVAYFQLQLSWGVHVTYTWMLIVLHATQNKAKKLTM